MYCIYLMDTYIKRYHWSVLNKPKEYVSSWGKQRKITREKAIEEINQVYDEIPNEPVYIICQPNLSLWIEQDIFYKN